MCKKTIENILMPIPSYPMAGHAVLLTGRFSGATPGDIAVLEGAVNQRCEKLSVTFRASAFNDGRTVQCSGGPATFGMPVSEFRFSGKMVRINFWRWKDGRAGAHRGVPYWMYVPLWLWEGTAPLAPDDLEIRCSGYYQPKGIPGSPYTISVRTPQTDMPWKGFRTVEEFQAWLAENNYRSTFREGECFFDVFVGKQLEHPDAILSRFPRLDQAKCNKVTFLEEVPR